MVTWENKKGLPRDLDEISAESCSSACESAHDNFVARDKAPTCVPLGRFCDVGISRGLEV